MALLLVLVFIVVPLAELYVIIQVGQLIGVIPTIAILLVDSIAGSMLLRSQGRAVWRRFNETMTAGKVPHREALDGALVIFGGALLLTPGFLTDIVGLFLLIPPTRALARRFVTTLLTRRAFVAVQVGKRWQRRSGRREPEAGYDVEGTATERLTSTSETPRIDP